jgi:hypothetical protein
MQPWQATHGAAFAVGVAPLHRMTSLPRTDHFLRPGQNNLRYPFHWALHQSVLQKCAFGRDLDQTGVVVSHNAVDWPASQEKSQDCKTGGSGSEMLERMSAHNRTNRIDLLVKEFQQLGQRIKRCSG